MTRDDMIRQLEDAIDGSAYHPAYWAEALVAAVDRLGWTINTGDDPLIAAKSEVDAELDALWEASDG